MDYYLSSFSLQGQVIKVQMMDSSSTEESLLDKFIRTANAVLIVTTDQ